MQQSRLLYLDLGNSLTIDRTIGVDYLDCDDSNFREIYFDLKSNIESTRDAIYEENAKELLSLLKTSVQEFKSLLLMNNFGTSKFYEIPILKFIHAEEFVRIFWGLTSMDQKEIGHIFERRYEHEDFNLKLKDEAEWLQQIYDFVTQKIDKSEDLLKTYTIKQGFLRYTEKAIRSLKVQ